LFKHNKLRKADEPPGHWKRTLLDLAKKELVRLVLRWLIEKLPVATVWLRDLISGHL